MSFNLFEANRDTRTYVDKSYVVFLSLLHIGAVAAFFMFSWSNVAAFFYLLSHQRRWYHDWLSPPVDAQKFLRCPKRSNTFLPSAVIFAMEGSPVLWVAQHRQHHKESDRDLDPHNIKVGFYLRAHRLDFFCVIPRGTSRAKKTPSPKTSKKTNSTCGSTSTTIFFRWGSAQSFC